MRTIQSFLITVALTFTTISYSANAAEPSVVGQGNNSLTFAASTADSRSQYLDLSPGINFGASPFTIETYFKTGSSLDNGFFLGVGSGNGLSLNIYSPNEIQVDAYGINSTIFVLPITMQINTWYHLAVARDANNNETVWLNGSRATSAYNRWDRGITYGSVFTDTRNYNGNTTGINGSTACGHCNQNHYSDARSNVDFSGLSITNFRVVVGSTVYDPNSATITPPDTPLTNIANTKLLLKVTNSSTAFTDSSGNQTVTNTGVTFTAASGAAGSIWTSSAFPNSKTAFSVLFANNLFIAAPWDQSATYVHTSTDGINWTQRSIPVSGGWEAIAYGNGIYVAVGDVGGGSASNKYIYSSDGVTWSPSNTVPAGATRDVAFGNGIFVAVQGGGCTNSCVRTSTNGITWTVQTTPTSGNFRSIVYTGSAFYATSNNGLGITSTDGVSWTSVSGIGSNVEEIAYGNSKFIAVSTNGVITYSSNFSSWTQGSNYSSGKNWQHVIYAGDKFVAIAADGTINISSDGINWSSVTSNLGSGGFLAFGVNNFVALSSGGNSFAYSVAAPSFTLSTSSQSVTQNSAITTVTISSTGGTISSYAISPAAPAGLTFNTSTGQLSGTPTATQGATTYTITGTNAGGSASQTFTLTVNSSKITPTFTWSNVTKSYGASPFTLTAPTASTAGTFTYSSATPGVIALNNVNTDSATVVAPGTSLITASFTPTDTATYNSATTTMTVTVSKAAQAALTFALSTASKNQPYSQAITMTPSGGTGTGAITYAIAAGGSASSCALANSTETNTITATSGGTCLIQATKATDTNYLVATSATQTFTFNAPLTLTYAAGELGTGTVPTLSGTYFAADTATVAVGSTLSRAGFTFNGWRNSSNTAVAAGSTFTFSTSETLTAQWRQSSLFGLSDNELTELQSWNASANTNSGTVSNARSSFTVTVPGSSLPTGTTVKLWEVANSNLARSKVGSDKDYIVNLVVSWLKSDGTVPTATSPVTLAISNSTIKNGAIAYQIIGDTVTQIGVSTADGVINLSVTEDPVITVANPAVVAAPSSGSSGGSSGGSAGVSSVPVITETKPVEELKKVEETKPVVLEQLKTILKMEHTVTFGPSAAWLNTKNIVTIRNFISKASEKIEIEKIVIKGFAQPTKISIPNIDIARANAVKKFLKKEGINYPIVATGAGKAKSKKPESSRIAIVIIEGKPKSSN